MAIQDAALLVNLRLTQWSAKKLDKSTSEEVCADKGAKAGSGNFNKQIIPKEYLKEITQLVNRIRNYHYENTLAWSHKGVDLLPSKHYMIYMNHMTTLQEKFELAVKAFLKEYPKYAADAMLNLQSLYNADDYPTVKQVERKFYMNIDATPVPEAGDFRVDVGAKELKKLKDKLKIFLDQAETAAEQDLFSRLYTSLAKAYTTLLDPNKIFRNTLIFNVEEYAKKVTTMNVRENTELLTLAEVITKECEETQIDLLRKTDKKEGLAYRKLMAKAFQKHMNDVQALYDTPKKPKPRKSKKQAPNK